jgi:hypothetical protein
MVVSICLFFGLILSAYKMTAVMDLLKIFQFVLPALPAARHDIERLRELKQEIEQGIDSRDVLVADKGYQSFEREAQVGTWYIKKKKPKNQEMPREQVELNAKIENIRQHIEFGFGSVELIFDCLLLPWRHETRGKFRFRWNSLSISTPIPRQ